MDCKTAAMQLLEAEKIQNKGTYSPTTKCIGLARIGQKDQLIVAGEMQDFLEKIDMGPPLHSFVICAEDIHPIEEEMFDFYRFKKSE